jgi:hypothetical protein
MSLHRTLMRSKRGFIDRIRLETYRVWNVTGSCANPYTNESSEMRSPMRLHFFEYSNNWSSSSSIVAALQAGLAKGLHSGLPTAGLQSVATNSADRAIIEGSTKILLSILRQSAVAKICCHGQEAVRCLSPHCSVFCT